MQSGQSATCPGMWALQGHSLRCLRSEPAQLKSSGSCWRLQCRPQGLYEGNRWFTPCSTLEQLIPSLKDRKVVIIYYFRCRLWKTRQKCWWMIFHSAHWHFPPPSVVLQISHLENAAGLLRWWNRAGSHTWEELWHTSTQDCPRGPRCSLRALCGGQTGTDLLQKFWEDPGENIRLIQKCCSFSAFDWAKTTLMFILIQNLRKLKKISKALSAS